MQLRPAVPTRTAPKSRRRLLAGVGVVALVIAASATSLALAVTPGSPGVPAGHPDYAATSEPASGGIGTDRIATTSDPSGNVAHHRLVNREVRTAGDLDPGSLTALPAGWTAEDGDGALGADAATAAQNQGDPIATAESPTVAAGAGPTGAGSPATTAATSAAADAAAAHSTSATGSSPASAAVPVKVKSSGSTTGTTTRPVATPPLSWTDLRGEPPTTTTTLETVLGYEVLTDDAGGTIKMIGNPGGDAFATGGIDLFLNDGQEFAWWVKYDGVWPPEGKQRGEKPGDDSWETGKDTLGVPMARDSGAASVAWSSGYTDVFIRGADDALYHRRGVTTWADWENLGGLLSSDPAVTSRAPGQLDVFARGPFAQLWHRSFDGVTWSDWENLGGDLRSEPAAVSRDAGHLDVFARGNDDALWHRSWSDSTGWSSWESLGGVLTSGPAASSCSGGRVDVFARGQGNTLWHISGRGCGGWQTWEDLGGTPFASSPEAFSWGQNRIDVFVRGTDFATGEDDALWHKWWDGARWLP